jgi:hypothetical protein
MREVLTCANLALGWAISAWVIPGQWVLIVALGAAQCVAQSHLHDPLKPVENAAIPKRGVPAKWGAFEANFAVGAAILCTALMLWLSFGTGQFQILYRYRPALTSGTANLIGFLLGATGWLAFNRRRLISK